VDLLRALHAARRLDARAHVDGEGRELGDGETDGLLRQAAGQHQPQRLPGARGRCDERAVEGPAAAAVPGAGRVEDERRRLRMRGGDRGEVDARHDRHGLQVGAPVGRAGGRRLGAVELRQERRDRLDRARDLLRIGVDEETDRGHERRQGLCQLARAGQRHRARAVGPEDEADGIGARIDGRGDVLGAGDAADLDARAHGRHGAIVVCRALGPPRSLRSLPPEGACPALGRPGGRAARHRAHFVAMTLTSVCIVGAGAIGGLVGTRLAAAGVPVSAYARGATLAALRLHGWRMDGPEGRVAAPIAAASDDAEALGRHDLVVIAVKGPALAAVAAAIGPLLGPDTVVLPAMNGVPWWFCLGRPGFEAPLESVDPGGSIGRAIPFDRVLGCVVHASASTPEAGLVRHATGNGLVVGEPLGDPAGASERAERLRELLGRGGFDVTVSPDVRHAAWYKLWGNLTMNPVSALTGATIDRVLADPELRALCSRAMEEASAVGARIGVPIDQRPEDRHAVTARLGAFRTSMLQDVDAGRPIELDAIVGAVHEIAARVGVATPTIDGLLGLARTFARVRGLYPDAPEAASASSPSRGMPNAAS
jgi:2-dehydropantoate 2-reductase